MKSFRLEGTKILTRSGESVSIDEISVGDSVVSYDRRGYYWTNRATVEAVSSKEHDGNVYSIYAEGNKTRCLPGARFLVKWDHSVHNSHAVYVMQRGERFRMGIAQMFYTSNGADGSFGPAMRARQELADRLWIASIEPSIKDAYTTENVLSYRFGIPQQLFSDPKTKSGYQGQEILDEFWMSFESDASRSSKMGAIELFASLGLSMGHPIWSRKAKAKMGREVTFKTAASNLLPKSMRVALLSEYLPSIRSLDFSRIFNVSNCLSSCRVFSISVPQGNSYVSDNILCCH